MTQLIDGADAYRLVLGIANDSDDERSAWNALVEVLSKNVGANLCEELANFLIAEEVVRVNAQLTRLLRNEPPPSDLVAYYFGLYDAVSQDENGKDLVVVSCYVAGLTHYDDEDPDTFSNPAWCPKGRYLGVESLQTIKAAEEQAQLKGDAESKERLAYAGQLGAALIVARFAMRDLEAEKKIIVGFEEGDHAVLRPNTV